MYANCGDDLFWEAHTWKSGMWGCAVGRFGTDVCSHALECVGCNGFSVGLSVSKCLFIGLRINLCKVVMLAPGRYMSEMLDKVETVFKGGVTCLTVIVGYT